MQILELNLPETFDLSQQDLKILLAGQLYSMGKLSIAEAAELAGFPIQEFISILSQGELGKLQPR